MQLLFIYRSLYTGDLQSRFDCVVQCARNLNWFKYYSLTPCQKAALTQQVLPQLPNMKHFVTLTCSQYKGNMYKMVQTLDKCFFRITNILRNHKLNWSIFKMFQSILYAGKHLTVVAVQFATPDQKNATQVQDIQQFLTLKYAITLYLSCQFLQSWNFLLCRILKINSSLIICS